MSTSKDTPFISLSEDSVFKKFFKGNFKWFYRGIIYDYTGIDINDYELYDNELNSGKKNNKDDHRLDIVLVKKDHTEALNIELNKYNCLKRNEMYLHSLSTHFYNKYQPDVKNGIKEVIPEVKQVNINVFTYDKTKKSHIALRDISGNIKINNFQIYHINLYKNKDTGYNGDKRLQMLAADSYEKLRILAKGDDKLMNMVKALENLGNDDDFLKVYNREADLAFMIDEIKGHAEEDGIKIGEERGKASGIKIGRSEGRNEGIKETARKMLKKNFNPEIISEVTGLSVNAVNALM